MALKYEYCLASYAADCSEAIFKDETIYGTLGNAERHEIAKKYLVYKMDINGVPTPLILNNTPTVINVSGQADPTLYDPDALLIPTIQDGWYKIVTLIFGIYSGAVSYTAETEAEAKDGDVIYYLPTNTFYYCLTNISGVAPDDVNGATYWTEITDFEYYFDNTSDTLEYNEWDDVVTCYTERAFLIETTGEGLEALCSHCMDFKEIEKVDFLFLWLNSMYAANNSALYDKAEKVARFVENQKYLQ